MLLVVPTFAQPVASSLEPVGDAESTRTVYVTVVALIGLAVGLGVLAVWLWKRTKPEPALLAPLEEMDTRAFRKLDPDERDEVLDEVRPRGWRPVALEDYDGPDPDDPADDETVAHTLMEDPADAPTVAHPRPAGSDGAPRDGVNDAPDLGPAGDHAADSRGSDPDRLDFGTVDPRGPDLEAAEGDAGSR